MSRGRFAATLNLQTLRLFVAICEEGSINRAAVREKIALSALSRRISDLEAKLDLVLLHRHSRGIEPTEPGLSFWQHANIVLRDVARMESDLAGPADELRGVVRLSANTWAMGNRATYITALGAMRSCYSPDGLMSKQAAETVLKVLSAFDENVCNAEIDLGATYDNSYVNRVPADAK